MAPGGRVVPFLLRALVPAALADDPLTPEPDDTSIPAPAPKPDPTEVPAPSDAPAPVDAPSEVPSEAPAPGEGAFNFDRLLITTVQPEAPEWAADAERFEALLNQAFAAGNTLVPMSEVPFFDVQNYDGRTYLLGCPPGRYAGCALVIGQRTNVERTIGATVRRDADPTEPGGTILMATVHVVDVSDGREVVSVTVPVPAGTEGEVAAGLVSVFDEVVRGDFALREIRDTSAGDDKAVEEARREQIAKALDHLEQKLGTAVISGDVGTIERPKLRRADLAEYTKRDDVPPWDQLGMGAGEYLRFANSGRDYADWQNAGWGRTTMLLARVSVGYGSGPWNQRYVGQVLLSDQDLQPVDSAQLLEVVRGSAPNFDVEAGVGLLPFLELDFAAGVRPGTSSYQYDEDVQNQIAIPGVESKVQISTWHLGGRLQVAPFPRWPARPTLGVGLARWSGAGIPAQQGFARIDAPTSTFLEVLPGVEVTASPHAVPFLRVLLSERVGGTTLTEVNGGGGLVTAPTPTGDPGGGFTVQAGLQLRFGPVLHPDTTIHPR